MGVTERLLNGHVSLHAGRCGGKPGRPGYAAGCAAGCADE